MRPKINLSLHESSALSRCSRFPSSPRLIHSLSHDFLKSQSQDSRSSSSSPCNFKCGRACSNSYMVSYHWEWCHYLFSDEDAITKTCLATDYGTAFSPLQRRGVQSTKEAKKTNRDPQWRSFSSLHRRIQGQFYFMTPYVDKTISRSS